MVVSESEVPLVHGGGFLIHPALFVLITLHPFQWFRVLSVTSNNPVRKLLSTNCAPNLAHIRLASTFLASRRLAQISSGMTRHTSSVKLPWARTDRLQQLHSLL